jgi:cell division protein FtsQ
MTGAIPPLSPAQPVLAGVASARPDVYRPAGRSSAARRRRRLRGLLARGFAHVGRRGSGLLLTALLFAGVGVYGGTIGGGIDRFVAENGALEDVVAKAVGFEVRQVTISGQRSLSAADVLAAAAVTDRNSLLFLDAPAVRERLMEDPLIRDARVRKLYPDQLAIEIVERDAFALWQNDGQVFVIASDGKPIETLRDERLANLPFVVGEGANERVAEFQRIVDAAGDFRSKIRAGVLVTNRRWNVKLTNGVDVKLPEQNPEAAIAALARLSREQRILDKDILAIDMRVPGRMVARLTEEAGAARAEALAKKPKRGPA